MRKFNYELNYLDLNILFGSNDLDIWFFSFQNEIYIKRLQNSVLKKRKKLYNPLKSL